MTDVIASPPMAIRREIADAPTRRSGRVVGICTRNHHRATARAVQANRETGRNPRSAIIYVRRLA